MTAVDTSPGRQVRSWLLQVLVWTVLLAAVSVVALAVAIPRVGGGTPYTVLTGSMQPSLPAGSLVVVRPADPHRIGIGSVITYQIDSGRPAVATHRVVGLTTIQGQPAFRTQGDANQSADRDWVRPEQVRGKLWYSVPHLGRVNNLFTGQQRQLAVYVVAGVLAAYAVAAFASSRRTRPPSAPNQEGAASCDEPSSAS